MKCTNLKPVIWLISFDNYKHFWNQNFYQRVDCYHQPTNFLHASSKSISIPIQKLRLFWYFSAIVCSKISYKWSQTVLLFVWRQLSIMFLRFIYVAACIINLFLFIWEVSQYMDTLQFLNSVSRWWTLSCSQILAIINKATMNILVPTPHPIPPPKKVTKWLLSKGQLQSPYDTSFCIASCLCRYSLWPIILHYLLQYLFGRHW